MDQPRLPFQRHSPTSRAAADSMEPRAGTCLFLVFNHIVQAGWTGATDEEIQETLGMNASTQRPRRIDLVKRGLVVDSGTTRPTHAGRQAVVWRWVNA